MRFVLFFLVFFAIVGGGCYYVGRRIIAPAHLPAPWVQIAWIALMLLPVLSILPIILRINGLENPVVDYLSWVGYVGLGFLSLLATGVIIRDLFLLGGKAWTWAANTFRGSSLEPDPERRRLLLYGSNMVILGAAASLTGYGLYEARRRPEIRPVDVTMPNLPSEFDGFRIAQITDIHVGPTVKRDWVEKIIRATDSLNADMVVFTGDFVDGTVPYLRNDTEPMKELNAPYGHYFVTGNHEYYSGVLSWLKEMERLQWDTLMNEHRIIERNGAKLVLAGVTDYTAGGFYPDQASDPMKAVAGAPDNVTRILLAHQPKSVFAAAQAGIDLQLSGHTHGGQFFPWDNLARLAQPYISGLHHHDEKTWIYTSRGTGYWGPPVRIGQPSEITLVTLRCADCRTSA
ncbi:MAG: metallophosphoesterase [Candidatus Zixiibacteriota bacterium]